MGAVALILWWAIFSRARWFDRVGGIVLLIVAPIAAWPLYHESMGPHPIFFYAIPVLSLAFVAGAVASRGNGAADAGHASADYRNRWLRSH